jgi:hypothetical protein
MRKKGMLVLAAVMACCFAIVAINSSSVLADEDIDKVIKKLKQSKRIVENSDMPVEDIDRVVNKLNKSKRILKNKVTPRLNPPKTGQTTAYDINDDGDLQMGAAWPVPRFTDNGDGTVTDNQTKLIWLKDANCIATTCPGFDSDGTLGDGKVNWQSALHFMDAITIGGCPECGAGYSDWRLPNARELHSLIDFGNDNPALPASHPFTSVETGFYWSSTTFEGNTSGAWGVHIFSGSVTSLDKSNDLWYVWPVRGGN